jgi:hypothetical protein
MKMVKKIAVICFVLCVAAQTSLSAQSGGKSSKSSSSSSESADSASGGTSWSIDLTTNGNAEHSYNVKITYSWQNKRRTIDYTITEKNADAAATKAETLFRKEHKSWTFITANAVLIQ